MPSTINAPTQSQSEGPSTANTPSSSSSHSDSSASLSSNRLVDLEFELISTKVPLAQMSQQSTTLGQVPQMIQLNPVDQAL